jgi:hypothetical protein
MEDSENGGKGEIQERSIRRMYTVLTVNMYIYIHVGRVLLQRLRLHSQRLYQLVSLFFYEICFCKRLQLQLSKTLSAGEEEEEDLFVSLYSMILY